MDLAGPFPMSQRGIWYILAVADYFSKFCEACPVLTIDAPERIKVFVKSWISHYSLVGTEQKLWKDPNRTYSQRLIVEAPTVGWNSGTIQQDTLATLIQGCRWASRDWDHFSWWHTDLWFIGVPVIYQLRWVIFGHELRLTCDLEFETPPEKPMPVNEFVVVMKKRKCV